jgi:hypothetical protein
MKLIITDKLLWCFICVLFISGGLYAQKKRPVKTVKVTNEYELVRAIAPDVVIELANKTFNLSKLNKYNNDDTTKYVKTKYVNWIIDQANGSVLSISGVRNLTFRGQEKTEIISENLFGEVIDFVSCRSIVIKNISFGHRDIINVGGCLAGVISFRQTEFIRIENSILFGCGTSGVNLSKVRDFTLSNSIIEDCTENFLWINNSQDIIIKNSEFLRTGQFNDLFSFNTVKNLQLVECTIKDNFRREKEDGRKYQSYMFKTNNNCQNIKIEYCLFQKNRIENFTDDSTRIVLDNCIFIDNDFDDNVPVQITD